MSVSTSAAIEKLEICRANRLRKPAQRRYGDGGVLELTEGLVNLVEKLLLELLVFNQLADACQALCNLVWRQSPHQVEDGVAKDSLIALRLCHFLCRILLALFLN